jgi:hypothetical protein
MVSMASVANLVEFPDGLGLNVPLFVQCKWCFDASTTVEPTAETSDVLCELTMSLDHFGISGCFKDAGSNMPDIGHTMKTT